jgi:hypothetical protein
MNEAAARTDRADSDTAFSRLAGACAIAAGVAGFVYSVAFIGLVLLGTAPETGVVISSFALLVGAVLTVIVYAGVYRLLLEIGGGLTLVALLLGVTGAVGATIHGGYDLAVALHPPADELGVISELPNAIDPRGLLTFGVSGVAALIASSLIARHPAFPSRLATLGYVAGALLIVIYLGRLIILTPTNPIVAVPAALAGFIVNPAWYIWLGLTLRRG